LCATVFNINMPFVFTVFSQDAELRQPVSLEVQPFDDLLTFDQPLDASLADFGEFYKNMNGGGVYDPVSVKHSN
jgi:hypothetical protein